MHREYRPADMQDLRAGAFGADHAHDHEHDHGDQGHPHRHDDRSLYGLTALIGALLAGELLFGWLGWTSWRAPGGVSLALLAALIGGVRVVYGALEALLQGRIGADVALAQACVAALVIGEPFVAAEVVFIALVGEVLEALTFARTRKSIHRLLDQTPRTARVRRDGREVEIPSGTVRQGDLVIVRPGERVPVDGPVLVGRTSVDQSALTGEAIPVDKGPGEPVYTGTVNQFGLIEVRAEKVGHDSTLGQVLKLVADAQRNKAPLERAADRLARYFLPMVQVVAGLTLLAGYLLGWPDVWFRTVAVLVVACPCALILATPAAVLASMAWLARHGVLIKGGVALERLASCDTLAFDKTGTLTRGTPEFASIIPLGGSTEADVLRFAASAESTSNHPIAAALTREATRRELPTLPVEEAEATPGAGVSARLRDGGIRSVLVGNRRMIEERGVPLGDEATEALEALDARGETPMFVAVEGQVIGLVGVRDSVRPEAHDVVHDLKHLGFKTVAILTGDRASAARVVAKKTHVKIVESELLPAGKADWVTRQQAEGRRVLMIGDGINDAPALASAHVGIALGRMGADLAAEAGDIVLLGEPLQILPELVGLSRATVRVIRQNIIGFAFGLNALAMGAAAFGILGPVPAALLHQAGSLLVLLNAMRLLAYGDWAEMPPLKQIRALGRTVARWDDRFDPGHAMDRLWGRWRTLLGGAVLASMIGYGTSGWSAIGPDEVALVRRFGRHVATLGPGLHLRWPRPIESVLRLQPGRVLGLEIGFRTGTTATGWESSHGRGPTALAGEEALLITGDGQLVELAATVQYQLNPAWLKEHAFEVFEPESALRPLAESAVREAVGRSSLDGLLTLGRREVEHSATLLLQQRVSTYGLSFQIAGVAFQDVHPPLPVVDAYRDVSRAESDRQRLGNEGQAYRLEAVETARGTAAETVNRAEADREGTRLRASGEADAFRALNASRRKHPVLTDQRIHGEAIAKALAGRPKLILDPGQTRPRHLILNDPLTTLPAIVGPPEAPDR